MTFDMNDAEPQKTSELIPDGTFAKVTMTIRPGGIDGEGEIDQGLLKPPKDPSSDVRMLDCEFTVLEGPHARRKFWQMFTVQGGKVDENGVSIGWKISKSTFRAMIDSALGLDPQDMSEAAKQKRILRGLADLSGITFVAKIKVEAERRSPLRRPEPPRSGGAADREGMEARDGRQGRAGEPEPRRAGLPPRPLHRNPPGRRPRRKPDSRRNRNRRRLPPQPPGRSRPPAQPHRQPSRLVRLAQRVSHDRRRVAGARHA